jgi:hypothetical protein
MLQTHAGIGRRASSTAIRRGRASPRKLGDAVFVFHCGRLKFQIPFQCPAPVAMTFTCWRTVESAEPSEASNVAFTS